MDVCRVLLQFFSVILITRARIYQVLCFEENNVFITIDNYALSRDELMPTSYHFEKRSADDDPPIKKAIQNEKKSIQKSSTSSQYQKKLASHIKTIADTVSVVQNTTESNATSMTISPTLKLGKEKYETNFSTDTTAKVLTSISSSTSVTTTAESVVTTLIPEVPPTRPSNITNATVDHHIYYNSAFFLEEDKAMTFWVNFEKLPKSNVTRHFMLSDSYRRAATVTLSFDFPFYGHHLRNITIATGGFLYMGDYMHSWLAATQYVAPLMANFDTSLSNDSTVQYYDNGTAFVIEWNEVALQDEKQGGNFTFQATLLSNGNIVFVYRSIPVSVKEIGDESHPVKVGLSDAYVVDRVIYFIRRKTIYEYHRIDMKKEEIGNNTAIYFTALTTCLNFKNCSSCMNANIGLDCVWCEAAKRCSDGLDRHRQHWLQQRCDIEKSAVKCNLFPSTDLNPVVQPYTEMPPKTHTMHSASESHDNHLMPAGPSFKQNIHEDDEVISQRMKVGDEQGPVGVGGVVSILLILGLLGGVMAWIGYAYRNPHTSSGQLLIRYRPSQWRFRSGEARYTAASVHM